MTQAVAEPNPRKVRIGLAVITFTFAAAAVLFFVVHDPIGRAVFFGVAVFALVRAVLLVRWLRRGNSPAA